VLLSGLGQPGHEVRVPQSASNRPFAAASGAACLALAPPGDQGIDDGVIGGFPDMVGTSVRFIGT